MLFTEINAAAAAHAYPITCHKIQQKIAIIEKTLMHLIFFEKGERQHGCQFTVGQNFFVSMTKLYSQVHCFLLCSMSSH